MDGILTLPWEAAALAAELAAGLWAMAAERRAEGR